MKTLKILYFVVLSSAVFAQVVAAQTTSDTNLMDNRQQYESLSKESLSVFRTLVTEDNAKALGFDSARDLENAKAGVPLPMVMIQLDDLREYQRSNDPRQLFRNLHQQLVPVLVGDEVRSSITVEQKQDRWQAVSFGSQNLVKLLSRIRQENAEQYNLESDRFFVAHVAALRYYFLAYEDEGKTIFIPVLDDDALGFNAGSAMAAEDVLASLVPLAKQYNGLPM